MNTRAELWAKGPETDAPYPLACHLLDTAAAADSLWRLWLRPRLRALIAAELGEDARAFVMLLAGLHDIGKANPVFQLQLASDRLAPWRKGLRERLLDLGYPDTRRIGKQAAKQANIRRHERVSAAHLAEDLHLSDADLKGSLASVASLGHHGSFIWDNTDARSYGRFADGEWKAARDDLVRIVERASGADVVSIPEISGTVAILLSGLVVLSDRLASQGSSVDDAQARMKAGSLTPTDPDGWVAERSEFFDGLVDALLGTYTGFGNPAEEIMGDYLPRGSQLHASSAGDGMWMIMAATGSGKTEAFMLRHSSEDEALTLLLPTQATTNAMMRRLRWMFRNTGNVAALAHGEAWLDDFYNQPLSGSGAEDDADRGRTGLFPSEFVGSRASRLLAPVTVGTIDQALMAALPLKWTHLRLLALANSHVVIDEVHTLDEYQVRLLQPLLRWLGKTEARVTLLSATLPTQLRDRIVEAYTGGATTIEHKVEFPSVASLSPGEEPLMRVDPLDTEPYSIDFELHESADPVADHTDWAAGALKVNPRARLGVVVNTIDRAQRVAQNLAERGVDAVVLHSRMSLAHRQKNAQMLEKLIGKDGDAEGIVVVGTQALEASLDIDLDWMSTDLAPPSSLIQRAGRVWRREDAGREKRLPGRDNLPLRVVRSTEDFGHLPYFPSELSRAWRFLEAHPQLKVPEQLQEFVEKGTARLDDIDLDVEDADDLYEEFASASLKSQAARMAAIDVDSVLDPDARVSALAGLTRHAQVSRDRDTDYPATRYRERRSQRVLITGAGAESVPGGWRGSREELEQVKAGDRDSARRALAGVVTVGGAMLRSLEETMTVVEDVPALKGVIAGPLPAGIVYDPSVGLVSE